MENRIAFFFISFCFLFFPLTKTFSQKSQMLFYSGPSFHGSGDALGFNYGIEYQKELKKRLNWGVAFEGSIHDGFSPNYYDFPAGNQIDGSYRYTTAGVEIGCLADYNLIKPSSLTKLSISLCGFARYQSSSFYDELGVYYPAATGWPFPLTQIINTSPQRTFAIGLSPKINFLIFTKKKYSFGVMTGFQFDTNGDIITSFMLTVGKSFEKGK